MDLSIQSLGRVIGDLAVEGDKGIAHRVAFLAAMADGPSCLRNFPSDSRCRTTLRVLDQLGISHEELEPGTVTIFGKGGSFQPPAGVLNCGDSGTTARLLVALLAGLPFEGTLDGSASLRRAPMTEAITSLREMGADITCMGENGSLPARIRGARLHGRRFAGTSMNSRLKSVLLFAGMQAHGVTSIEEPLPSRDHTERAMALAGLEVTFHDKAILLAGGQTPRRFDVTIPGDLSHAACWMALAAPTAGSRMILRGVSLNALRLDFVDALVHMGAGVREEVIDCGAWEWNGHLDIRGGPLRPFHVTGKMTSGLLAEFPLLAVMAAKAEGTSLLRGAAELRNEGTDRISSMANNLSRMGVAVEEFPDGLAIHGTGKLRGAAMECHGDARLAMALVIAGLLAEGTSIVRGGDCIAAAYPRFRSDLEDIMKTSEVETAAQEISVP
jgi:3-phosphoshikimate 1-carboxyvinyltransferase